MATADSRVFLALYLVSCSGKRIILAAYFEKKPPPFKIKENANTVGIGKHIKLDY